MNEKCSVLIVDDDQMVLIVLEEMVSRLGYRCETAMTGLHALELLDGNHFDVMITDLAMPRMQGFELIEQAKILRPDRRIIVVSGFISNALRIKAIETVASDFVEKPISLGRIGKALQGLPAADRRGYEREGTGC